MVQFNEATNRGSPLLCVGGSRAGVICLAVTDTETCRDRSQRLKCLHLIVCHDPADHDDDVAKGLCCPSPGICGVVARSLALTRATLRLLLVQQFALTQPQTINNDQPEIPLLVLILPHCAPSTRSHDVDLRRIRVYDSRIGATRILTTGGTCSASPLPPLTPLRKEIVDSLFTFSHTIAYNYTGRWQTGARKRLVFPKALQARLKSDTDHIMIGSTLNRVHRTHARSSLQFCEPRSTVCHHHYRHHAA